MERFARFGSLALMVVILALVTCSLQPVSEREQAAGCSCRVGATAPPAPRGGLLVGGASLGLLLLRRRARAKLPPGRSP